MGRRVAQECVRSLTLRNCINAVVTVLGMTFKEDVPDIRNSKVIDIVRELERFGLRVQVHDPFCHGVLIPEAVVYGRKAAG
jgi:UDP-N-acetyl-D-galactosamine dehydrogenase